MKHISFIMDGNGRWAEQRNLPRLSGHEMGARALVDALEKLNSLNIEYTSFYAFSTDNDKRNPHEVSNILGVIAYFLQNDIKLLAQKLDLCIRVIGDLKRLPEQLTQTICQLNSACINNKGMKVLLAIGYGGDVEICHAFDTILRKRIFLKDTTPLTSQELFSALYTSNVPNPDIVIRYGGHSRLSNFMPLQTAYSELFFLDALWPDFDIDKVKEIVDKFYTIKRNFGGTDA